MINIIEKEKISKNFFKGNEITSIDFLFGLVKDKKSVYVSSKQKSNPKKEIGIKPATFVCGMPVHKVAKLISYHKLFEIEKDDKGIRDKKDTFDQS